MKATQHKSLGRLADLNPFDIRVTFEAQKPSSRVRNALWPAPEAGTDSGDVYGCVDWYQYPVGRADRAKATD